MKRSSKKPSATPTPDRERCEDTVADLFCEFGPHTTLATIADALDELCCEHAERLARQIRRTLKAAQK